MTDFLPDATTVRRAQGVIADYRAGRVQIIADRPGNPLGAEIRRFGRALATRVPPFGKHPFNSALGFSDEMLEAARRVVDWYQAAAVPGAFEITPGLPTEQLLALLHARGYRHASFHATLAGRVPPPRPDTPGVEVRRVSSDADLRLFSEAYHLGWGQTDFTVPVQPWRDAPGWRLYLALCAGEPAGAAILYLADGEAYLADSAVDPRFRRRGVHRALLDRRCRDAALAGSELIFAGADYLSASYRNMLRTGLGLLHTKAIWTRDP